MARKLIGSAKENLYYHNTLILHKSEKQTVKNQLNTTANLRHLAFEQVRLFFYDATHRLLDYAACGTQLFPSSLSS